MARTARQAAALRKAQLASARKRKGHGKFSNNKKVNRSYKVAQAAAVATTLAVVAAKHRHVIHGAVEHGLNQRPHVKLRHDIRRNLANDPVRRTASTHLQVYHHVRRGNPEFKFDAQSQEVLKYRRVFTNKLSQQRMAKRKTMTAKERRASIPSVKRKRRTKKRQ